MAGKKKSGYDGKIAGLYDLEETIGQGHFAVVKLARHVFTGEKVAVKVIDKQKLDDISRSHLFQEVRCMKLVQHPNVVRLYEVIDTQTKLYLILELGDGDMYDYIMRHNEGLDETLAKKYFGQIVEAILYCHRLHVVHRDLKPENVVFFNKLGVVKLTDFGFSNVFAPGKKLETSCGSLAYSAPEILLGDSYDPPAVDVWSLGVILFMLVVGRAPFQEANDSETLTMIMDCKYQIPAHVSESCRRLITRMLVRDPSQRISLEDIERDQWLTGDLKRDSHIQINLPLLSREHVSEEDHNYVVQKMVEGKICTKDEIFQSLERDAYDHIAATYYLLVERRLRKLQQQQQQQEAAVAAAQSNNNLRKQSAPANISTGKPHLEPLMLSPRKQKDAKKTKTAPIHQTNVALPTLVITPPTHGDSASHGIGLSVSPGGSEFVKSLTTSMTLDRRSSQRKRQDQHRLAFSSAHSTATMVRSSPTSSLNADGNKKSQQKVKSAPLVSPSGEAAKISEKKKRSGPSFSKIAILSSFFERKAAQEAGLIPRTPPHQRLFPWSGGKDRKSKQRIALSPNSPTSLDYSEYNFPSQRSQSSSSEHSDSSSLVQSLVSPPGTHPSPASPSPKTAHLSPDAIFAAVRKCSLIREESLDDDDDDLDDFEMEATELKPSRSLEFLEERTSDLSATSTLSPPGGGSYDHVNPRRPLKSVCSSPQLLNQIHEENESEDEDDFVPLKLSAPRGRYAHSGMASPEILRKYEQRRRRKGAGQRGTSCSSSDASDTDDTEGRSRKDKLKHKFMHRRDSSDHSSDTDGPSGGNNMGGGGRLGNGGGGSKPSHRSSRRDGGGGGGGDGGSGSGGGNSGDKSGKSHSKQHCLHNSSSKFSYEDLSYCPKTENRFQTHQSFNFTSVRQDGRNLEHINCSSPTVNTVSRKSQLVRQKPVNGFTRKWECLDILRGDLDLLSLTRKLSSVSASSLSRRVSACCNNSSFSNSNIISNSDVNDLDSYFGKIVISQAHTQLTAWYIGHNLSKARGSSSLTQPVEFSEISDYCTHLLDSQSSVSLCLGTCGMAVRLHHSKGLAHVNHNELTWTCCNRGAGGLGFAPAESNCCSVV